MTVAPPKEVSEDASVLSSGKHFPERLNLVVDIVKKLVHTEIA